MSDLPRPQDNSKEWKLIEKTLLQGQTEQRRARRWGIFFKLLTFAYLIALLVVIKSPFSDLDTDKIEGSYAAVVDVKGVIAEGENANANALIEAIQDAFDDPNALGLILRINSPGGSPVQSGYVFDEIRRQKKLKPKFPVYAVIADLGASGAYYIAAAADEIYADKASLVGSIGVIGAGFGFVESMQKVGVKRRLYTAGEHKAFLDPFSPEKPEEKVFWQGVLKQTHQHFINQVRLGRGLRLQESAQLFSGLIWTGEKALEYGLIDGFGSARSVAREQLDTEKMKNLTLRKNRFEQMLQDFSTRLGKTITQSLLSQPLKLQ